MKSLFLRRLALLSALLLCAFKGMAQESASQILSKSAQVFKSSTGLVADFTSKSSMGQTQGTIALRGDKFYLDAGGIQTWFDGKTQWSYMPGSDEVNILTPTKEQLQSLNPYSYLTLTSAGYTASLESSSDTSRAAVRLTTSDKSKSIQTLYLEIDRRSYLPQRILVNERDAANKAEIKILGYQNGKNFKDDYFRFDLNAHPDTEIIDLR